MKRIIARPIVSYLAFTFVMLLLAYFIPGKRETMIHYLLVFFAWNLAVCIHEFGHLIAGWKNKLTFVEMTVMFLRIVSVSGKVSVQENKDWKKVGGVVYFSPDSTDMTDLVNKWKWLVAGGPLSSFFWGITFLLLSWIYPSFFINILGYMNIAIGIITIIPFAQSDSSLFFMLRKKDEKAKNYLLSLLLFRELFTDKPPSLWTKEVVDKCREMLSFSKGEYVTADNSRCRLFLYYYYYDCGNLKQALEMVQPVNRLSESTVRNDMEAMMVYSLYITHTCLWDEEAVTDFSVIDHLRTREPYSFYRTKAAVEVKNHQFEAASASLQQAQKIFRKWVEPYGYSVVEKQFLNQIEQALMNSQHYIKKTF